ncbi:hypothetical protein BCF11_0114 [Collimonas sp. PA-H2]|uniref:hypothetical protein n=1 Tax=Collimonas sp. PA-H2 TaxID=1881062 RepID=UPI000BF435F0|nr:hypothetical protein [Collimonas sp. PA-H2]PFH07776.1 hypothetical protein BCF11_0114 [Collimonas sp. PA-H2]
MKKLLLTLLCISTIGAALPAFAGPDWQLIEQARKAKQLELAQTAASKDQQAGMDGMMKDCMENMGGMASMNPQAAMGAKAGTTAWHDIYNGH